MSVIAPPQISEPAPDNNAGEALIEEAKQRARRRRRLYGAAVVVVAIAGLVAFSGLADTSPPGRAGSPASPPRPAPLGAPVVVGSDEESTLLASWGRAFTGYVLVYADGRVLWNPFAGALIDPDGQVRWRPGATPVVQDGRLMWQYASEAGVAFFDGEVVYPHGPTDPDGEFGYPVLERRLNAHGLDLVRSGHVAPEQFLIDGAVAQRKDLWAETTPRLYEPSHYAVCLSAPDDSPMTEAALFVSFPPAVQDMLHGKQRTYDIIGHCFELTAAEASTLHQIVDPTRSFPQDVRPMSLEWIAVAGGQLRATAIYPHGQPVIPGAEP